MEAALAPELRQLCPALLAGLQQILGHKLFCVVLHGAIAFPEGGATGDLDYHAILGHVLDRADRDALVDLHAGLARDYPPLGAQLDGWYILLDDALRTECPPHQLLPSLCDHSWALHRAHMRAGRCFVLHGPEPRSFLPAPSWLELERALEGELDYVTAHLPDAPAYCVLNLCRLVYSFLERDVVVSKRASAAWALGCLPGWRSLIQAALRSYDEGAAGPPLRPSEVAAFHAFAREQIRRVRSSRTPVGQPATSGEPAQPG